MSYDAYMEHGYGVDLDQNPLKSLVLEDLYNMVIRDTPQLLDSFENFDDFDNNSEEYESAYNGAYGHEALIADYLNEKFFGGNWFFKYEGGCLYVADYMPSHASSINPMKEDVEMALRSINDLFSSPATIQPLTIWIS